MTTDPTKIYLNPVEKDPIKQNSAVRQLIENAASLTGLPAQAANSVLVSNGTSASFTTTPTIGGAITDLAYTAGGLLFADTSGVIDASGIGIIAPGHNGVVGDGSTNDAAAIFSLLGSNSEFWICPGNYAIATSKTIGNGKRITFLAGSKFIFSSGTVWDFTSSEVIASVGTQCFSCPNNNNVKGLINSTPEMFGAKRDGSTDDSGAITAAINAIVLSSGNSKLLLPTCRLSRGNYMVASQISITLPAAGSCCVQGSGYWGDATVLLSKSTSSGTCLLFTGSSEVNLQLREFQIINQTHGSGASQGLYLGINSHALLNPSEQPGAVMLDHIYVSGFAINYVIQNIGGVLVQFCQSWGLDFSGNLTTGSTGFYVGGAAGQIGTQVDFSENIINPDNSSGYIGIHFTDGGSSDAGPSGCRLSNNVFYGGTTTGTPILFECSALATLGVLDIWIEAGNQFENQQSGGGGPAINMIASNGGIIQDIHIDHCYFSGQGWTIAINGQVNDTSSKLRNIFITGCFFVPQGTGNEILFSGNSGAVGNVQGIVVSNNIFYCGSSLNTLGAFQYAKDVSVIGNVGTLTGSPTIATGFSFFNTGNNETAIGNVTHATTPVFTSWTTTSNVNNI